MKASFIVLIVELTLGWSGQLHAQLPSDGSHPSHLQVPIVWHWWGMVSSENDLNTASDVDLAPSDPEVAALANSAETAIPRSILRVAGVRDITPELQTWPPTAAEARVLAALESARIRNSEQGNSIRNRQV